MSTAVGNWVGALKGKAACLPSLCEGQPARPLMERGCRPVLGQVGEQVGMPTQLTILKLLILCLLRVGTFFFLPTQFPDLLEPLNRELH